MAITPKAVKEFTRDSPCTKVDLFNCFNQGGAFGRRAVVEARGEIGLNAIKYLLKKGYATAYESGNVDYWQLTATGQAWLTDGLQKHLERHPEDRANVCTTGKSVSPRRMRRTR